MHRSVAALFVGVVLLAGPSACALAGSATVRPASHVVASNARARPSPPQVAFAAPEDAIVRVVGPRTTCSGTLVEEDLVLTAHHCIVERGSKGEFTKTELSAKELQIELGGDFLPWGTVGVRAIVAAACGEAGGYGDIALLVLERKVVGIPPMSARLDEAPSVGEVVDPAGFGRCLLSPDGIHRRIRMGGPIVEVRPGTIFLTASICPGDSGGPIFVRGTHNQVVGVVSASAMDADEKTAAPSVMARVDAMRAVFSQARSIADGVPRAELPPLGCGR